MTPSLEATLARVPHWAGKSLTTSPLTGGITNRNYRVDVDGESFVLRLAGAKTSLLGIDRPNEYAATVAAAAIGVGPEVIYFIEPEGYLVTRFIAGRPIPPDEMRQPENLRRVAGVFRRVHALPPIPGTFSPFRIVEDYDRIARDNGVDTFPENYGWLRERMAEVESAFLKEPFTPSLCHDDFLNENFLFDGEIRILDWEYAGMGDVFFDLANFSVNHGLTDDEDQSLLQAYFGEVTPRRFARQKLMKIMSDFREAMWGVVQQGLSSLDFDFRAYADKHFARMTQNFSDPRYAGWLKEFQPQSTQSIFPERKIAMSSSIPLIVSKDLKSTALHSVKLESRQFDESWLQELLFAHPELLPTDDLDPSYNKLIPLAREFPTTVGPIDVLYATPDGSLCIVETKLWRNPEAHRTVLAQVLEYARHLVNLDYSSFKAKVEAAASRDGVSKNLVGIMKASLSRTDFDDLAFEEGVRQSLSNGNFLLLIVGDRIRSQVVMLSEIIGAAPSLEFTLRLVEIAFYHMGKESDWPVLAVPSIVGKTHEETRAVVKIRYEQKQPEVEVVATEKITGIPTARTDMATFLKSLPEGLDEVFQPYLERWTSTYTVYWGTAGLSLKCNYKGKWLTILLAFPKSISLFVEKWLQDWDDPVDAYQTYREQVDKILAVQRVYSQKKNYASYEQLSLDEVRVILDATDRLAEDLTKLSPSQSRSLDNGKA